MDVPRSRYPEPLTGAALEPQGSWTGLKPLHLHLHVHVHHPHEQSEASLRASGYSTREFTDLHSKVHNKNDIAIGNYFCRKGTSKIHQGSTSIGDQACQSDSA